MNSVRNAKAHCPVDQFVRGSIEPSPRIVTPRTKSNSPEVSCRSRISTSRARGQGVCPSTVSSCTMCHSRYNTPWNTKLWPHRRRDIRELAQGERNRAASKQVAPGLGEGLVTDVGPLAITWNREPLVTRYERTSN